jgi:uncharacterized membrane protein
MTNGKNSRISIIIILQILFISGVFDQRKTNKIAAHSTRDIPISNQFLEEKEVEQIIEKNCKSL